MCRLAREIDPSVRLRKARYVRNNLSFNKPLSISVFIYFPLTMIERLRTKAEFLFSALKRRWWLIVRTLSRGSSVSMAVLSQTRLFRVWNPVSFTSFRKCRQERQELRWVMEKCSKWHKKEQREFLCVYLAVAFNSLELQLNPGCSSSRAKFSLDRKECKKRRRHKSILTWGLEGVWENSVTLWGSSPNQKLWIMDSLYLVFYRWKS